MDCIKKSYIQPKRKGYIKGDPIMCNDVAINIDAPHLLAKVILEIAETIQEDLNKKFPVKEKRS